LRDATNAKTKAFELVIRRGKLITAIEGWKTIDIHSHDEDDDAIVKYQSLQSSCHNK
jgi:hypothetical protein